jgi:hypothetical protein
MRPWWLVIALYVLILPKAAWDWFVFRGPAHADD